MANVTIPHGQYKRKSTPDPYPLIVIKINKIIKISKFNGDGRDFQLLVLLLEAHHIHYFHWSNCSATLFFFFFLLLLFVNCKPWLFKEDSIMHFFIIGSNYPLNQNLLFKYSLLFFPITAAYCLISNYYRSVFFIHFRQDKFHAKGFLTNTSVAIVRRTLTL